MDRGTIIYDIERCTCRVPDACRDCSHYTGTVGYECMEGLMRDALALLKEQQNQIWELQDQVEYLTDKQKEHEKKGQNRLPYSPDSNVQWT